MSGWLGGSAAEEPGYEIDVHGLPTWPLLLLGLVLDGVALSMVVCAVQARRRGEDVGRAAASAVRAVGPPALGLVLLIVAGFLIALIVGVVLVMILLGGTGVDVGVEGLVPYLGLAAFCIVGGVVILVWWTAARTRLRSRSVER